MEGRCLSGGVVEKKMYEWWSGGRRYLSGGVVEKRMYEWWKEEEKNLKKRSCGMKRGWLNSGKK